MSFSSLVSPGAEKQNDGIGEIECGTHDTESK